MKVGHKHSNELGKILWVLPLLASSYAYTQSASPAPIGGGDSAQYFFEKSGASATAHPSRTGDHGAESPMELWSGDNNSFLRLSFKAEMIYAAQNDSWFGESQSNLGESSDSWWETGITPGMIGSYFTDGGDEIYGELNFVATSTQDIDAAGSNVEWGDTGDVWAEKAYVGWRSGSRWSDLGKDFLDISFGRQQYVAGNGFLFFSQSSNGGKRGGYWLGIRKSADLAGIIQVNYKDLAVDMIYLEADDQVNSNDPNNNTKVGGITLDYSLGDFGGIGGGFYAVNSEEKPRDGMDIIDARFNITAFKQFMPDSMFSPLNFEGEYVNQDNGDSLEASAWYLSAEYPWKDVAWSPSLTYRYASFEGGDDSSGQSNNYDPLFYGFYDWGYWYQGEVLGEYVLSNSNLNSSMVRVGLDPTDDIHVNLFYYNFKLDDASSFGVQSEDFADEYNVTVDWTANEFLLFSLVGAYVKPDDGAKEYTGGDDDWYYMMIYASYSFK